MNVADGQSPGNERIVRLVVLGSPGAGKSTLARQLAVKLKLPLFHMDDLYWGPSWTRPDPAEWVSKLRDQTTQKRWIIDGNYHDSIDVRLHRAQALVLMTAPVHVCLYRAARRALRIWQGHYAELPKAVRTAAEDGLAVAATKDFWQLMKKIFFFPRRELSELSQLVARVPQLKVLVVQDSSWLGPLAARRCSQAFSGSVLCGSVDLVGELLLDWSRADAI